MVEMKITLKQKSHDEDRELEEEQEEETGEITVNQVF
jgi:hypothetical protein